MARARPFLRTERLTTVTPTLSASSVKVIAGRIPGAKLVELPGVDHLPWVGDQDSVLDEIQEFLTHWSSSRRIGPLGRGRGVRQGLGGRIGH
jgi:hypothetical protein